jgi:predicted dehydrogenase
MWTGPAPLRPYDNLPHKRWWRAFMEYGNGIMGDMCIHMLDMVRWMLDLGWPTRISSTGGIYVQKEAKSNIADTQSATFEFLPPPLTKGGSGRVAANGGQGGFTVTWQHRTYGNPPDPEYPWAGFIYGDKGTLKASVHRWDFFPTGKKTPTMSGTAKFDPPDKYPEDKAEEDMELHAATANRAHMKNFTTAIANRSKPVADIEQGHISTASCILANLSMQLGRTLTWDPAKHQVVGDEEANKLLRRPYRGMWKHPDVGGV